VLAWRLWKLNGLGQFDIFSFVTAASAFLVRYAPLTQQERWEENAGYSPSTLAVVISALVCAADICRGHAAEELASFLLDYADWIEAHLELWTTTKRGILLPDVPYHYMRIRPPAVGEPFHNADIPAGTIRMANREPGEQFDFEARGVIDGGFLELVRYGVRRADDPLIIDSLKVVDHCLKIDTPYGPCWRRYNHDGYGQRKDGGPYEGWGQGRAWPILTGERAHYELAAGQDVKPYITAMEQFSSIGGMLPEQVWDYADLPSEGMYFGRSAGSAQPLVWAHAEYLKLLKSVADGQVFDRISVVAERYAVEPGKRNFASNLEIFQTARPISCVAAGKTLRIMDQQRFRVVYSTDNWATKSALDATYIGRPGAFADIATTAGQTGSIVFTLYWPDEDRWLGHNCELTLVDKVPDQGTAADKPQS
jgi:glucoamylase